MAAARRRKHNLVIVESPAKVKTIKKFLGSNYEVTASYGHVRDLPKSRMGIDVDHDYEPKYITIRGKGELLADLRKKVKKADRIYLATDPDREGEAISWHLVAALKLDEMKDKEVYRITFNEITKKAVTESLKNARSIDMNLVDAQQTRRILDRVVGYRISPLLWEKVKRGLSAGRVQSVALRMIGDREEEISAFIPQEYWTLDALLKAEGMKKPFTVHYYGKISESGKAVRQELEKEEDAKAVTDAISPKRDKEDLIYAAYDSTMPEGKRYNCEEIAKEYSFTLIDLSKTPLHTAISEHAIDVLFICIGQFYERYDLSGITCKTVMFIHDIFDVERLNNQIDAAIYDKHVDNGWIQIKRYLNLYSGRWKKQVNSKSQLKKRN